MLLQRELGDRMADDCQSVPALDVPFLTSDLSIQDDEMLSWLQYPVDDIFDRTYCFDSFGGLVNTNPSVQLVKDAFLHQNMKKLETAITKNNDGGTLTCANTEEKAGVTQQIPLTCKIQNNGKDTDPLSAHTKSIDELNKSSAVQTRKISTHQTSASSFPQFSRPVAATLDSLRLIGAVGGPTNIERARKPPAKNLVSPSELSDSDINCTVKRLNNDNQFSTETSGLQQDGYVVSTLPDKAQPKQDNCKKPEEVDLTEDLTCLSDSANVPSESGLGAKDRVEITSSPSYNTNNKASDEDKKKSSPSEETEITDNPSANARSGASNARTSKRNRSAESHNESEKKRRNRINLRLKALQELIPNSNKTDKASVLDEAIEYTKMLQAQIQLMSMRTGLFIPPMMMPAGVQYLPVQQIPLIPQMGMGMINVKSTSAGALQSTMAFPPMSGLSHPIHMYPGPHVSAPIVHASSSCVPIPPSSAFVPSQPPPQLTHSNMQNSLIQQKQT